MSESLDLTQPDLVIQNKAFINNEFVDAASGKTFECLSPIDGRKLADIAECDSEDVDRAVKAARTAFDDGRWSMAPPRKRKAILLKFADLILANAKELAMLDTLDIGKPIAYTERIDVRATASAVQWYAEAIDKVYDEVAPTGDKSLGLITREPLGVVAAVVPWNFPAIMASWKFAPALAAGNSIILKPAEQSPLSALKLAQLAAEAGMPDGVFNVLPGYGETAGQALGRHMDVDMVAFTGSTEVGKYFLRYSGESNMKHISLECGGKSPNIIFSDVPDLDAAARTAGMAIFFNSGQVCTASSRLLVQKDIHDEFLEKVKAVGDYMKPGNPLDPNTKMGTMVDQTQLNRVMDYIDIGSKEGADLAFGGKQVNKETGGAYIEPTIFDNVKNDMRIAQEEIFGPVLATVTFEDEEQALQIANDTIYGLQASLWTSDINKAHNMARRLQAGTVYINATDGGDMTVPFGGFKQSGIGRDKSLHGLHKYTQLKTTFIQLS